MIRITLEMDEWTTYQTGTVIPAKTIVREFSDEEQALNWFVQDSYFAETYTRKATWERID